MDVSELVSQILQSRSIGYRRNHVFGGEPFAHAAPLAIVAASAHDAGLSVMAFSGYTLDELHDMNHRV